jgi:cell division protein FtsB
MNTTARVSKIRRSEGTSLGISNFVSIGLSIIFIALSGLLVANSIKSVSTAHQRSLLLDQAKLEVQDLRLRNLELMQELDYVTSSSYVEEEARNRLLYTKNDEVLVVLPQTGEKVQDEEVLGESDEATTSESPGGWDRWLSLLIDGV